MADLPAGSSITLSAGRNTGKTARVTALTQAALDSVRAEAYSQGWREGCGDTLTELERAHAFTTAGARRTVTRIRKRLELDREPSDTIKPPTTEAPHA